ALPVSPTPSSDPRCLPSFPTRRSSDLDLHWIDAETQALLDGLAESLPTARLLLLVNYRPEYQHGWGHKTYYSQLRLDALLPESAGELLTALLGDDPALEPLKRLLVRRGNPFFIEESIRDRKSTRLNSSHGSISYAVFCLKKKKRNKRPRQK